MTLDAVSARFRSRPLRALRARILSAFRSTYFLSEWRTLPLLVLRAIHLPYSSVTTNAYDYSCDAAHHEDETRWNVRYPAPGVGASGTRTQYSFLQCRDLLAQIPCGIGRRRSARAPAVLPHRCFDIRRSTKRRAPRDGLHRCRARRSYLEVQSQSRRTVKLTLPPPHSRPTLPRACRHTRARTRPLLVGNATQPVGSFSKARLSPAGAIGRFQLPFAALQGRSMLRVSLWIGSVFHLCIVVEPAYCCRATLPSKFSLERREDVQTEKRLAAPIAVSYIPNLSIYASSLHLDR